MDRAAVLKRLLEEESRLATGWVGRKGQEDPVGALRELLERQRKSGGSVEVKVRQEDAYLRAFFMTLCRRYGLRPFRKPRQQRTSMMLEVPEAFLHDVFWPLYKACSDVVQSEMSAWYYALMHDFRGAADAADVCDDELVEHE